METILLCAPEGNNRKKVERFLQKTRYRFIVSDNIDDAFRLFRRDKADLLLLSGAIKTEDLALLCESVRNIDKTVPVLFYDLVGSFALSDQISFSAIDDVVFSGSTAKELSWRIRGLLKQSQSMRNQS